VIWIIGFGPSNRNSKSFNESLDGSSTGRHNLWDEALEKRKVVSWAMHPDLQVLDGV
jgi:hypothetical protein